MRSSHCHQVYLTVIVQVADWVKPHSSVAVTVMVAVPDLFVVTLPF